MITGLHIHRLVHSLCESWRARSGSAPSSRSPRVGFSPRSGIGHLGDRRCRPGTHASKEAALGGQSEYLLRIQGIAGTALDLVSIRLLGRRCPGTGEVAADTMLSAPSPGAGTKKF